MVQKFRLPLQWVYQSGSILADAEPNCRVLQSPLHLHLHGHAQTPAKDLFGSGVLGGDHQNRLCLVSPQTPNLEIIRDPGLRHDRPLFDLSHAQDGVAGQLL